jgi:hypothetical protein
MPRSKRKQAVVAEASEDGEPPLPAAVNEAQDTIVGNMAAADDEALCAMDVVPDEPVKLSRREQRKLKKSDADGGVVGADVNSDAGASAPTAAAHQPLDATRILQAVLPKGPCFVPTTAIEAAVRVKRCR